MPLDLEEKFPHRFSFEDIIIILWCSVHFLSYFVKVFLSFILRSSSFTRPATSTSGLLHDHLQFLGNLSRAHRKPGSFFLHSVVGSMCNNGHSSIKALVFQSTTTTTTKKSSNLVAAVVFWSKGKLISYLFHNVFHRAWLLNTGAKCKLMFVLIYQIENNTTVGQ